MAELSSVPADLARKIQTVILQRLASVGQVHAGSAIGKSETWVSRWKSDDLESCAALLAALGVKVVPASHQCFAPEYVERLRYFAEIGIKQQPAALEWEAE